MNFTLFALSLVIGIKKAPNGNGDSMCPFYKKLALILVLMLVADNTFADITNAGLLDNVLDKYSVKAAGWASYIKDRATWLYWTLVVISMVWTFGFMALRKADISELFAEFIRFTITTGFFWWLLINGPNFAKDIIDSMRQLAGTASGAGPGLSPSGIVDVGFDILGQVLNKTTVWQPLDSLIGIIIALVILVILALVAVNMLLLLISGWILAYGGIFYLGFGGSRWTSDIAINYFKTVLGIAMQLFCMVLLVGIGKSILDEYYNNMSGGLKLGEMAVILIVSVVLLLLVNKIPPLISGVINGAGVGDSGIGSFGAGAALGAAGAAAAAAAYGGGLIASGAAQAAGGAQALMSAISKAQDNVSSGSDILSSLSSSSAMSAATESSNFGSGSLAGSNGSSSAFAQAAGFSDVNSSIAGAASSQPSEGSSPEAFASSGSSQSNEGATSSSSQSNESATSDAASSTATTPSANNSFISNFGRVAADAAANLAVGAGDVAKAKVSAIKQSAQARIAQTFGGQVAAAIQNRGTEGSENSIAAASESDDDLNAEVREFAEQTENQTTQDQSQPEDR